MRLVQSPAQLCCPVTPWGHSSQHHCIHNAKVPTLTSALQRIYLLHFTEMLCRKSEIRCLSLSRVRLFVTLWTIAHQAPLYGILQASILEWVAIPFSGGSFQPRDRIQVSYIAGRLFTVLANRERVLLLKDSDSLTSEPCRKSTSIKMFKFRFLTSEPHRKNTSIKIF